MSKGPSFYLFIIAIFKAANKRKTTHSHIFLPKNYSGDPYAPDFTPYSKAEVLAYLDTGWGISNVEVDLSRYDAALLIAFTAKKEIDYGTETDGHARRWLMIWVSAYLH